MHRAGSYRMSEARRFWPMVHRRSFWMLRHSFRRKGMEDVRDLKESQLDAIREVANIGAGHAATALSEMTNRKIMITVPRVKIRPVEDACDMVGPPDQVVASVLMHVMGDLTGRAMLLFPERAALTLCDFLF